MLQTSHRQLRVRRVLAWTATGAGLALAWFALVGPVQSSLLTPPAFARIPLEGLVLVAVLLLVPARAGRVVALVVGVLLALLLVVRVLDIGFFSVLDRPFDPASDAGELAPAVGVLRDSVGTAWAATAVVGAVLGVVATVLLVPFALVRLSRTAARHRRGSAWTVGVAALAWVLGAVLGLQVAGGTGLSSTSAAQLTADQVRAVAYAVRDRQALAAQIADDRFAATPAADLLTGLRGKDVLVAFVESYGKVAVQGSPFAPQVDAVLHSGTAGLRAAGFSTRSAFLTSPTFGGISWLAHSTLQSGVWIDDQRRYDQLLDSHRLTLSDAFRRAGWRTVADVPSNEEAWSQGASFYHYDAVYGARDLGYRGPRFSYATMPDQYILSSFQRLELAKRHHQPVMAEIDLVSSHTPWAPLPHMVPWDQVGDGSVFDGMPQQGQVPSVLWRDPAAVGRAYGQSIQYSLSALVSFVETVHDDNLVLLLLGDHQPSTTVSGTDASHDVPVTIVAHDPQVMQRIASWGWTDGMLPGPGAPVWPMSAFRDRFLTAFGSPPVRP